MDIYSRISKVRAVSKESQEKFALRLGLSRNFINQVENKKKNVSDRTILDICREYHVNEEWLRNGTGEMFLPSDRKSDIAKLTKQLLDEEDDSFKNRFISMLANLSVDEWEFLERRARELCGLDEDID
jgi:transcriptional regulator with XRE-family HTH domain